MLEAMFRAIRENNISHLVESFSFDARMQYNDMRPKQSDKVEYDDTISSEFSVQWEPNKTTI